MTYLECTVHCHTNLCDGKNTPAEMAAAAAAQGIKVLGLSGHSHTPHDDSYCMTVENTARYRNEIARLNEEYAGRLTVLCGLEWDQWSDENLSDWDYTVGSAHYVTGPSGVRHSVDHNLETLQAAFDDFGGDGLAMAEMYFAAVADVARQRPTVLGHFDLIKKLNGDGRFFDENHPRYRAAALAALEAAADKVQALEINTGGVARGYRAEFYPAPFLLKRWKELGGKIILTADAHTAEGLLFAFEQAAEYAKACGFTEAVVLNAQGKPELAAL
jgi:histidinol-phosphatase (PHP family)